ncbi:MAG: hypothetical protein V3U21_01800 [Thermodesulfobacteriota bacterium]
MTKTVKTGFEEFLTTITPSKTKFDRAKKHGKLIRQAIKTTLGINLFFQTGSFRYDTSIKNYSYVDYFVSIPKERLSEDSKYHLSRLCTELNKKFPTTGIKVKSHAIVIPSYRKSSESIKVYPARHIDVPNNHRGIFEIPRGDGGWLTTSPGTQDNYVTGINKKLDDMLKPLIRLMKAWKYFCDVPINSHYLEMRIANEMSGYPGISYEINVPALLEMLLKYDLRKFEDPLRISGYINACSKESKKDAISKLKSAVIRANHAYEKGKKGDISSAFIWWNKVFNKKFASYN